MGPAPRSPHRQGTGVDLPPHTPYLSGPGHGAVEGYPSVPVAPVLWQGHGSVLRPHGPQPIGPGVALLANVLYLQALMYHSTLLLSCRACSPLACRAVVRTDLQASNDPSLEAVNDVLQDVCAVMGGNVKAGKILIKTSIRQRF